jgi:hypothetical protein
MQCPTATQLLLSLITRKPKANFVIFQPAVRQTYLYFVGIIVFKGTLCYSVFSYSQVFFITIHLKTTYCDKLNVKITKFLFKRRFYEFNLV